MAWVPGNWGDKAGVWVEAGQDWRSLTAGPGASQQRSRA